MTPSNWLDLAALIVFCVLVAIECGAVAWIHRKARKRRPPQVFTTWRDGK
jgi:hypothetical protein